MNSKKDQQRKYAKVRTLVLPGNRWFCTDQLNIKDRKEYKDLYNLSDYDRFLYNAQEDFFEMKVLIAQGKDGETDGDNCQRVVTNGVRKNERLIRLNYDLLELGELDSVASKNYGVAESNNFYYVGYYFFLTPKNTFPFQLQQTDQTGKPKKVKSNLCSNSPVTLGVVGKTTGHYKIKSITYQYNADNEKDEGTVNQDQCRDDQEQTYEECWHEEYKCPPEAVECLCCKAPYYSEEPKPIWRDMGTVGVKDSFKIRNIDLNEIMGQPGDEGKNLKFRSRIELYNGQLSEWKESDFYMVYPGMPDLDPNPVNITPACYKERNGSVTFKSLKEGIDLQALGAQFFLANKELNDTIGFYNPINGNAITLGNLSAGSYRLNYFIPSDNPCEGYVDFIIEQLDSLESYGEPSLIQPQCHTDSGSVRLGFVEVSGWQTPLFSYNGSYKTATETSSEIINGRNVINYQLNGFPKGVDIGLKIEMLQTYSGQMCKADKFEKFTFDQVERVNVVQPLSIIPSTCNTAFSAAINIEGIKGGIKNTSYAIRWYDEQDVLAGETITTADTARLTVGKPGGYHVVILDNMVTNCPGMEADMYINAVSALSFDTISVIDNPCTASQLGQITGRHPIEFDQGIVQLFDDTNKPMAKAQRNSTWNFDALASGAYTVKLTRSETCADFTQSVIKVSGPPKLDIFLKIDPISCMDSTDAKITALITDHQRGYDFWWKNENEIISKTDLAISHLPPGDYHL
ncbi:MAG: hypothetical protein HC819_21185 [Cyclobacteriaceae bacterium]|nr:hypothetical protein [Cyclobacteriaceae bacterium]